MRWTLKLAEMAMETEMAMDMQTEMALDMEGIM